MEKIERIYSIFFRHSLKRTFFVLGTIIVALSLPLTIFLSRQQQDLRQEASTTYYCVCQGNVYYDPNLCFEFQKSGTCNIPFPTYSITATPTPTNTSNTCETCISQDKKYRCPGLLGGYTCSNFNWGFCSECKPTATVTPTPTAVPTSTPTTAPTKTPTPTQIISPTISPSAFPTVTLIPSVTFFPSITIPALSCDPVPDGVINELDFVLWKEEFTKAKQTILTSCFSPNNQVDLIGFQILKDIMLARKQPF